MRAELAALSRVQGLFEQRSENGRLYLFPIRFGGLKKLADFFARQGEHSLILEQIAVEFLHVAFKSIGKAAGVHRLP